MTKDQVCDILEEIALLVELKGENTFKVRAYQNAARALEVYAGDFAKLVEEGRLEELSGIGKAIAEKISTLVKTGSLPFYQELRDAFPPEIFQLFELQGLGAKKIKVLYEQLQVNSLTRLERVCQDGLVAALPGFGAKTQAKILEAIEQRKKQADKFRRGDITPVAEELVEILRTHPDVIRVSMAGSYRRAKEIVGDLDIIVSSRKPESVMGDFVTLPAIETVLAKGPTKSSVLLKVGIQCDLRVVADAEFPFAILYFTGSKEHNVVMRGMALDRGWTLNEYRLAVVEDSKRVKEAKPIPAIRDERELYRALDLDYVPPELRESNGEFEAAAAHALPDLLEWSNLRGTFHNHTTASDGRNTLAEMVQGAYELGLEYFGIADHSKSSFQANGLTEERLLAQVAEIQKLRADFDDIHIFTGAECDILKDGRLDFADEILAQLDYVVASVHNVFSLTEEEMTKRLIRAMENRYVTMLGHLTGRLLLTREGYQVNIPKIIDAAAETGTWIELNANPRRLDMDWRWWRIAKEKGVKCVINPDAHRVAGLQDLHFGVGIARKGWLTRADVVNCLPYSKMKKELGRKREKLA